MPGETGKSALKRFHASKGRSETLLQGLRLSRVVQVLKDNKQVLYDTESQMIQDGHLEPIDMTPRKKSEVKAIKDGVADDSKAAPTAEDSEAEDDDDKEFNRNQNNYGMISAALWGRAFRKCDPRIFTKANIRAMTTRGQRAVTMKTMQDLAECLLDVVNDDTIDMAHRTKAKFILHVVNLYVKKGNRGSHMAMPVKYEKDGPYITHKRSDIQVEITRRWDDKKICLKIPRGAKVFLDLPHSTLRCTLRCEGTDYKKVLNAQFKKLSATSGASSAVQVAKFEGAPIKTTTRLARKTPLALLNTPADAGSPAKKPRVLTAQSSGLSSNAGGDDDLEMMNSPGSTVEAVASSLLPQDASASSRATVTEVYGVQGLGSVKKHGNNYNNTKDSGKIAQQKAEYHHFKVVRTCCELAKKINIK